MYQNEVKKKLPCPNETNYCALSLYTVTGWNFDVPLWSVFLNFFILRQVDKAEVGSEDLRGKPVI